jgi:cell division protein FtsI/penicillin-binding protein 2
MSIGQGYLLSTPLQMLDMTMGVAMDGKIFVPRLLKRITDQRTGRTLQEKGAQVLAEAGFDKRYMAFLKGAMEKVVTSGTGKKARIPGVRVAGKTGTSENPHGDNHAWFGAYAPAQAPTVAAIVFVENGGEGGLVAAPMAKRLIEQVLGQEVTPWRTPTPEITASVTIDDPGLGPTPQEEEE